MDILLTDGSGLTSRQAAIRLASAGHRVEVLSPTRFGLAGLTRHVKRVHPVPAYGVDPAGWLRAALAVLGRGHHDVLLPTQEQAALLSREAAAVHALGTALAVPPFSSLRRVQDKAAQAATLAELELPHPHTAVAHDMRELRAIARPPVFVKAPIGTASSGVRLIRDAAALEDVRCPVVVQAPLDGPLTMIQAVYDHGRLVAWHACLRERLGVSGGAAVKRSIRPAGVAAHLERLGSALQWHGALSLDAILTAHGPSYIDVNPRLVEPANAWHAGIDLVGLLVAVSLGRHPPPAPPAREGVRTHQLLLAVLGAAEGGGRRAIARELILASTRRGPYADSTEELTPIHNDPLAAAPVAAAALATLVRPAAWRRFAGDAVANYALTPQAWSWISRTTR